APVSSAQQPAQPPAPPRAQSWTWENVKDRFEQNNPTLLAAKLNIDESKAQEITAFLRPNPQFGLLADGTQIAPHDGVWRPFAGTFESPSISYLHERRHKRELRLESAKKGDSDRRVESCRLGENSALQLAWRICLNAAGKSRAAVGQRQPCLLRPRARYQ